MACLKHQKLGPSFGRLFVSPTSNFELEVLESSQAALPARHGLKGS